MIGVVVAVYNSADVIIGCLESLLGQTAEPVSVVLVDNASPDDSIARAVAWATGALPYAPDPGSPLGPRAAAPKPIAHCEAAAAEASALKAEPLAPLTLLRAPRNLGYAGAVNLGLALLAAHTEIELLWVLNPDCVVPPETPAALLRAQRAAGPFAIMGSRIVYYGTPDRIHADGGRVRPASGICESVNRGAPMGTTPLPDPHELDYVIGANMVVSRDFLARTGPMREDYFLYYEEVDWALRRGNLPLAIAPNAVVYHHGGTAIGTGRLDERPSAFANYFNYRNRMRFMRRFHPARLPLAYALNLARIAKSAPRDDAARTAAAFRGLTGLPPPVAVAARVGPDAATLAFGRPEVRVRADPAYSP
jgi:GT2 family glycosyltransferase